MADLKLLLVNGDAIESISTCDRIVFDKTGTLTLGRPSLTRTDVLRPGFDDAGCRAIAGALNAVSTHPIARAFQLADIRAATDVRPQVGAGVTGDVDGRHWRLGKPAFVDTKFDAQPATVGGTEVLLGDDDGAVARFLVDDPIRPDARAAIAALRRLGLSVGILSGDAEGPVSAIAGAVDIEDFSFGCSAAGKLDAIRSMQVSGARVIMVGDGINDAPVLAGADASIAPAHAASLARTSADIVFLGDSLAPVVTAVRAARSTMRVVRQNLAWAILYNALALPLAATGFVPPWLAAIGMSTSSLVVVMNALRLGRLS